MSTRFLLSVIFYFLFMVEIGFSSTQDPTPLAKTSVVFEMTQNSPLDKSQKNYLSGRLQPSFGFKYKVSDAWTTGVGAQFKSLFKKEGSEIESTSAGIYTLFHESLYIYRLYHPMYLMIGPKLLYLLPSRDAKLPLKRDPNEDIEFGIGFSCALAFYFESPYSISFRADLWRGTKTTRLYGNEIAFGGSIGF